MKKIFIIIISLVISCTIAAQQENADAVYLKLVKEYQLNPNGSFDYTVEKELKLLTHYAFHRLYGETFIIYNPDYQKLDIDYAYTIMADGKKVTTPENAFNKVLPRYAAHVPVYNNLREMVVTHTGLEVGAVINLGYTIHTQSDFLPAFMGKELIGDYAPIAEQIIRIKVPVDMELDYQAYNIRTSPDVTSDRGFKTYTWIFKDLPIKSRASNKPVTAQQGIVFSTAKDLHRVYDKFMNQDAFRMKTTQAMSKKVKELINGSANDLQSMVRIQDFVINEIAGNNVPLDIIGFKVRTPAETWSSNGGNKLEKTLLLVTMLRDAGFNAIPVAVIPGKYYNKDMGNLLVINNYLVRVSVKGYDYYYISATGWEDHNLKYDLPGNVMLQLDAAIESLRTFTEKQEVSEIEMGTGFVIEDPSILNGSANLEINNALYPFLELIKDSTKVKSFMSGPISSSNIKEFKFDKMSENKADIGYEFQKKKPLNIESGIDFLDLPYYKYGVESWHLDKLSAQRTVPFELSFPISEKYHHTIVIPDEQECVNPEKKINIKNEAGELIIEIKKAGDEVVISREIELPEKIIPVTAYDDFRTLMLNWYDPNYRQIVIKK